jgi:hypothetical protein
MRVARADLHRGITERLPIPILVAHMELREDVSGLSGKLLARSEMELAEQPVGNRSARTRLPAGR